MSIGGLSSSVSALQSILVRQDVMANNLANVNTPGFKRSRAFNETRASGGTDIAQISTDYSQGPIETATNAFDLGIQGEGFFKVQSPNGSTGYVRAGIFGLNVNRELVTPQGLRLSPSIQLPADATGFAVQRDGTVLAMRPGGQQTVGQITLTRFPNPGGLLQQGGGVLTAFPAAGVPQDGIPGTGAFGSLATGLEGSNVDLAEELVNSMTDLRTFQINTKVIRTQDEMLGTLLDIRH